MGAGSRAFAAAVAFAATALAGSARAELSELAVAQQYGIGYLTLMMMEEQKLIEKHAKDAGLDVKVTWAKFAGGNVMNDALLSGTLHIASGGVGPLVTLWSQLAKPDNHLVLNSYDAMGGPATFNLVWTTAKFRSENPRLYEAFTKALDDATAQINRDRRAAAQTYLRISKDEDSVDNIVDMLNDPAIVYTTAPQSIQKFAEFMAKTGTIKTRPDAWKDLFFPNVHALPGS